MPKGGLAWRGWFPVRGELTSGEPDQEGVYFGTELAPTEPRGAGDERVDRNWGHITS